MKCTKCGEQINESAVFCSHCGEKVVKEPVKNDKKTNKKLFVLFVVEIVFVILMILGISSYYNKHFSNQHATQNEFKDLVNGKNYILKDATQSYGDNSIKSYDFATVKSEDLGIHYIVADGNHNADKVFNNLYHQIESQKQSGSIRTVSVDLINYNYYSLENGGNYFVVVKNDNTIFAATGLSQYKDEINAMVENLGFGYPSSILYVIAAIVIIIFILMIVVMWRIFVKAGVKGWKSLIPFYNYYCLSKITFNKGWLFILLLITPINFIFMLIIFYKLAKRFGKSTAFAVCSAFFPYITMQIIAFDNSKYISYDNE